MKTTPTISQQQLEEKAINAMIAYEHRVISKQEMIEAIARALQHYGNIEGHRAIVVKGWIIKTIYALNNCQLKELERITRQYMQ